jgi:hypothetical protein
MTTSYKAFSGEISVTDFFIIFGAATISADKQKVVISYKGYASPALSDVVLSAYQYSIDNGSTWSAMTASAGTELSDLAFGLTGTSHTFEWEAKTDVDTAFYNISLRVRFNATSGVTSTGLTSGNFYFPRVTTNSTPVQTQLAFPASYAGQSGADLLKSLAPKF